MSNPNLPNDDIYFENYLRSKKKNSVNVKKLVLFVGSQISVAIISFMVLSFYSSEKLIRLESNNETKSPNINEEKYEHVILTSDTEKEPIPTTYTESSSNDLFNGEENVIEYNDIITESTKRSTSRKNTTYSEMSISSEMETITSTTKLEENYVPKETTSVKSTTIVNTTTNRIKTNRTTTTTATTTTTTTRPPVIVYLDDSSDFEDSIENDQVTEEDYYSDEIVIDELDEWKQSLIYDSELYCNSHFYGADCFLIDLDNNGIPETITINQYGDLFVGRVSVKTGLVKWENHAGAYMRFDKSTGKYVVLTENQIAENEYSLTYEYRLSDPDKSEDLPYGKVICDREGNVYACSFDGVDMSFSDFMIRHERLIHSDTQQNPENYWAMSYYEWCNAVRSWIY